MRDKSNLKLERIAGCQDHFLLIQISTISRIENFTNNQRHRRLLIKMTPNGADEMEEM